MVFQNVGLGRVTALVLALLLGAAPSAWALDVVVTSFADDGGGAETTLREAIELVNGSGDATNTISFDAALDGQIITLASNLTPVIANVEIIGTGATDLSIDGVSTYQIFTITGGSTVSITDLDLVNGTAQGGAGASRGGGGLGAGGALFVDAGSDVTLDDITFDNMTATGGDGGPDDTLSGGGGGATIGSGGSGSAGGAGGGGGFESDGADGSGGTGGDGGGLNGGSGGSSGAAGADGGDGGGGGGAGSGGADGGAGGAAGGGGGASGTGSGGDGGFGGGGGGAGVAGSGGSGGFGAGDGSGDTQGDGGDGLGGAIFVREGGVLRITASFDTMGDTDLGVNMVNGGTGDTNGSVDATDLYLMTGVDAEVFVADAVGGDTLTVAGTIAGDGAITKIGAGTLVYAGANSYTGGTTVSQGILRVEGAGTLPGDVLNDSQVVFAVAGANEYSGDMSGSGSLTKQGGGELTLSGSNSYSGGTTIVAGTLAGDSDALQGDIAISGGANVRFDQPTNGTYAGDLSGAGAVEKKLAGTLTLTGDNSGLAGIFTVTAGAIQAGAASMPSTVDVANAALVIFDESGSADYGGVISGAGDVTKTGNGRVSLLGAQTWTGATTVAAGELTVAGSGSLAMSDVTVQSGARLSGAGSIGGSVLIEAGATIAPGDGIATFSIGATTFEAGSVYEVELNPDGLSSDLLMVTGTLDLLGGTVEMILPGDPGLNLGESFTYEIANSTGLLSGVFDGVDEELAFFDSLLAYPGNLVELTLTRNAETLVTVAGTRNQRAVGTALELAQPPSGDLITVFDGFFGLSVPELQAALDAIGGEGHTAFTSARIAHAEAFARTISSRMAVVSGRAIGSAGTADLLSEFGRLFSSGPGVDLLTSAPGPAGAPAVANSADISTVRSEDDEGRLYGLWLDGIGVFGEVDGDGNSADTEWTTGGVNAGLDLRIGQHALVGIAGGWGHLDVDVDDRGFDGEADVYQGSLYGAWVCERFYISGLARYARAEMESNRDIVYGSINRKANADYDGNEYGGYVEAGYVVGAPSGYQLEPIAALHVVYLDQDSFTENGSADSINLEVDDNDWTSIVASGGIRVHKTFLMDEFEDLRILPELRVRFGYELGDDDRDMAAFISGATTGGAFTVQGASMNRAGLQVGTGWSVFRGDDLGLFIQYDVSLNDDFVGHTLALGGVVRW